MTIFMLLILSYLLGTIPTAYLVGLMTRKGDIRKLGSGNVGGMNVYRVVGLLPALLTVLIDIAKGYIAVFLALRFGEGGLLLGAWAAFFAVLGHNYNLFLRLKGGKGLATALGSFLALSPATIGWVVLGALILTVLSKDFNCGFGGAAALIPPVLWLQLKQAELLIPVTALALVILIKHLKDFLELARGQKKGRFFV